MDRSRFRFVPLARLSSRRGCRQWVAGRIVRAAVLASVASVGTPRCDASLTVVGTRFVYPADARALTILARNSGSAPILVQAWLDDGDSNADPSRLRVPFVVAPPLARLDPGQPLSIRVQAVGGGLASDRESCFWINLLEVPPAAPTGEPVLRIAYRFRMKLLVRPPGLRGEPDDAPSRLAWTHDGTPAAASIAASNPTPYYVTLTRLSVNGEPVVLKHGAVDVAPFGRAEIPIDRQIGAGAIVFDAVDESGASHEYRAQAVPPCRAARQCLQDPSCRGVSAGIRL
ncbi:MULTISPECIES: fimbria/pilus periplasmic chaperone [Burkholderia]|uniref:fimbrial biogenesis chaperone n=1 Tax=Burkholderia TaxID=32008 RepID=UPI000F0247E6|nr:MULTISPECIES: fimbria/pilus periplasmic chaperone [Burkholderia]TCW71732.1 phytochrome sensor protein [Burkholderia sp. SRS-25]